MDKETSLTSVPRAAHCLRVLEARALQAERRALSGDISAVPDMVAALERSKKTREYMGLPLHERASATPPPGACIIRPRADLPLNTVQMIVQGIVAKALSGTEPCLSGHIEK